MLEIMQLLTLKLLPTDLATAAQGVVDGLLAQVVAVAQAKGERVPTSAIDLSVRTLGNLLVNSDGDAESTQETRVEAVIESLRNVSHALLVGTTVEEANRVSSPHVSLTAWRAEPPLLSDTVTGSSTSIRLALFEPLDVHVLQLPNSLEANSKSLSSLAVDIATFKQDATAPTPAHVSAEITPTDSLRDGNRYACVAWSNATAQWLPDTCTTSVVAGAVLCQCESSGRTKAQRLLWCSVLPALTMERAQATGRAFPTLGACAHGAPPCRSHTGELDATCLAADVPGVAANWTAPVCAHQVPPASIAPCLREWHLCIQRTGQPAATSLSPCLGATLGRTRQRLPCV